MLYLIFPPKSVGKKVYRVLLICFYYAFIVFPVFASNLGVFSKLLAENKELFGVFCV